MADQLVEIRRRLEQAAETPPVPRLSEREQSVLELMTSDLTVREIADTLFLSKDTVASHRRQIYKKLAVTSRADAVIAARRYGLLPESGTGQGAAEPPV